MKKKVSFLIVIIVLLLIVALLAAPRKAGASDGQPPISAYGVPHVLVFEIDSGHTCVTDYRDGNAHTVCYCPCFSPECTVSTNGENPVPSETPVVPEPTKKPKCNSGRGNASEGDPDCDPSNSGGHNKGGD